MESRRPKIDPLARMTEKLRSQCIARIKSTRREALEALRRGASARPPVAGPSGHFLAEEQPDAAAVAENIFGRDLDLGFNFVTSEAATDPSGRSGRDLSFLDDTMGAGGIEQLRKRARAIIEEEIAKAAPRRGKNHGLGGPVIRASDELGELGLTGHIGADVFSMGSMGVLGCGGDGGDGGEGGMGGGGSGEEAEPEAFWWDETGGRSGFGEGDLADALLSIEDTLLLELQSKDEELLKEFEGVKAHECATLAALALGAPEDDLSAGPSAQVCLSLASPGSAPR
jgi:hypothetical protein